MLFDFDGTLVSGDNGTRMIFVLGRHRRWPLIPLIMLAPVILPFLFFPPTKHIGASAFLWLATVGISKKQMSRCLQGLAAYTATHSERYIIDSAWQRLLEHQQQGDRIVVVTGCWEKQAKKTLKALGLKNITVVGSRKQRFLNGYISKPHCYGRDKISCLAEHSIEPVWKAVYTDSVSDRFLFQQTDKRVLVRPSNYSLRRMQRLFDDIELLH